MPGASREGLEREDVSSVDDVLLNTVGARVAALVTRRWWQERCSFDSEPHTMTTRGRETSSRQR